MKHVVFTVPETSTQEQVYEAVGIARRFPLTGNRSDAYGVAHFEKTSGGVCRIELLETF